MNVLGVITARGDSKGIPGKNLKPLGGRPLIVYTIDAARDSGAFDRLVLSTDDVAIADAARALGCEVPFLRPADLARDETPHLPVMQHAVSALRERDGYLPDAVMILQPTSPLRQPSDIRGAVDLLQASGADSVVSVTEAPAHVHPMRMLRVAPDGTATLFGTGEPIRRRINRRQDLPQAWVMNGAIYLFRTGVLFADEPSLYGNRSAAFVMPPLHSVSIDDPADWIEAERALHHLGSRG